MARVEYSDFLETEFTDREVQQARGSFFEGVREMALHARQVRREERRRLGITEVRFSDTDEDKLLPKSQRIRNEGFRQADEAISSICGIPVEIYNVPGRIGKMTQGQVVEISDREDLVYGSVLGIALLRGKFGREEYVNVYISPDSVAYRGEHSVKIEPIRNSGK